MKILLNDKPLVVDDGASLQTLLSVRGFASKAGLAVAVNQSVVPAGEWDSCEIVEGDSILLIQATQGG